MLQFARGYTPWSEYIPSADNQPFLQLFPPSPFFGHQQALQFEAARDQPRKSIFCRMGMLSDSTPPWRFKVGYIRIIYIYVRVCECVWCIKIYIYNYTCINAVFQSADLRPFGMMPPTPIKRRGEVVVVYPMNGIWMMNGCSKKNMAWKINHLMGIFFILPFLLPQHHPAQCGHPVY